jgi:hypothetical protein
MRGVLTEVGSLLGLDLVVGEEAPAGSLAVLLLLYSVIENILLPLALRVLPAGEKMQFCKNKKQRIGLCNSSFKGTVSRDGYSFEGLNILIRTFCLRADGFQGLSKAFQLLVQLQLLTS